MKVLSRVFRGKFVAGLKQAFRRHRLCFAGKLRHLAEPKCFAEFLRTLFRKDWVVYAKPAFGGPTHVLGYLGRYTHRVAISNHRLLAFDGERVTFRWRDYARGNKQREMTVSAEEFIRRFLLHVLPRGFVRIRCFGFLANCHRKALLEECRRLLATPEPIQDQAAARDTATWSCPVCHGGMHVVQRLTAMEISSAARQCLAVNSS